MNYLLTATVLLFVLWPAYYLLLRYSEKYSLNRLLLLLAMVAVCALPFVELESPAPVVTQSVQSSVIYVEESMWEVLPRDAEPSDSYVMDRTVSPAVKVPLTLVPAPPLYLLYGGILLLSFLLLGLRLAFILRLHLRSRPNGDGSYRLLHPSAKPGQAFTFGHLLYFSIDVPDDGDFEHILAHERVHARQLHTLDILLSEVFLCLFWFHPAAWWLRTKMRANLEYLVDREVVNRGSDRRSYQLALVRQSQAAQGLALALPFSEPSLKSRIVRLSGMPEYRLVGVAAALGLLLWMGVAMVTLNGTMGEQVNGNSGEYLAASAMPGDPYFNYYQRSLPDEVTSMEFYLNRMVTVDEYLQLRAIVSQVPGAKIYVYSQPYDLGYNLEIRYGPNQPATLRHLKVESAKRHVNMLGLEEQGAPKAFLPIAMDLNRNLPEYRGETGGMITYWSGTQTESDVDFFQMTPAALGNGLRVYVNREQIQLINTDQTVNANKDDYDASVVINGTDIASFGANDWPKVVVEGRTINSPRQRMSELLSFQGGLLPDVVDYRIHKLEAGTFRSWFEAQGLHKYRSLSKRYNDRFAKLDMLLDTEFGPGAMMQLGYRKDRPGGMLVVQVIDDTPYEKEPMQQAPTPINDIIDFQNIQGIDLYFKRLPAPKEVAIVRMYLEAFPGYDLRVFQDCQYEHGNYTLYLGDAMGSTKGFSNLGVGDSFDEPLHFNIQRNPAGEIKVKVFDPVPVAEELSKSDVLLVIDNGPINSMGFSDPTPFEYTTLDSPPAAVSLKCKSNVSPGFFNKGFWMYTYQSTGPEMMEDLLETRDAHGHANRPMIFYIGEKPVDIGTFGNFQGDENSYVQMGLWTEVDHAPLVVQIIE